MDLSIPDISDEQVGALVAEVEKTGFAVIPAFIDPQDLVEMRQFVGDATTRSGQEYVGFTGPDSVRGSAFEALGRNSRFRDLIERLFERSTGMKPPQQDLYQVLRCLTGKGSAQHSYLFHYDSYVVTVLIPVEIPGSGLAGDLLMLPNTRSVRSTYRRNVIDKVLLDNPLTQFALRKLVVKGIIKATRIKMVPGNAYIFWGYRSIHTNEPCDPDKVRATALYHYANPHAGKSRVTRKAQAAPPVLGGATVIPS